MVCKTDRGAAGRIMLMTRHTLPFADFNMILRGSSLRCAHLRLPAAMP